MVVMKEDTVAIKVGIVATKWDMAATEAINTIPQKLEHPSSAI